LDSETFASRFNSDHDFLKVYSFYKPIIDKIARRFGRKLTESLDIIQEGHLKLAEILNSRDLSYSAGLEKYIYIGIYKHIISIYFREKQHNQFSCILGSNYHKTWTSWNPSSFLYPLQILLELESSNQLDKALQSLTSEEKNILSLRFGLYNHKPHSVDEIIKISKLKNRNHFYKIFHRALIKLKNSYELRNYFSSN
jgi:RNA polymerase sigma factor (sigma-70 family)